MPTHTGNLLLIALIVAAAVIITVQFSFNSDSISGEFALGSSSLELRSDPVPFNPNGTHLNCGQHTKIKGSDDDFHSGSSCSQTSGEHHCTDANTDALTKAASVTCEDKCAKVIWDGAQSPACRDVQGEITIEGEVKKQSGASTICVKNIDVLCQRITQPQ